ncbi:putative bacteriocin export ABC transporter [Streptococcus sciuri]|uniref:Bacteriocin export ABC transporter n=1 Tax=Streptococcus sciuri TaxID=2973939 RepID=A0ABT2F7N7_9STRE|nr:putative bacteriocin export ABC transporter [Streptococcus sciuri]MCS4488478.1 putative bacteriocin export ABC transporter [Streptococcus sciuri]
MITIEHLTKRYGTKIVIDDLSCTITSGEMLAIVGPSGCGKTSLLNILGLIDSDYEGIYTFNQMANIKANTMRAQKIIRHDISYLFQNFALLDNATVKKNLELALKYERLSQSQKQEKIAQALDKVGLPNREKDLVATLSGGEQQRVAVARAMIKPSQLILADEPTGSLDDGNKQLIMSLLKNLQQQGKTVILVTHDLEIAHACDRILYLESKK